MAEVSGDTETNYTLTAQDKTAAAFASVRKNMEDINDRTERMGKAMTSVGKVFGIAAGAAGIGAFVRAAFDAQNALNKIDAAKIETANKAVGEAQKAFAGVATVIGAKVAPYIQLAAEWFTKAVGNADGFRNAVDFAFNMLTNGIGLLADGFRGLEVIWKGLELAWRGFTVIIFEGIAQVDETISNLISKIPGMGDVAPSENLRAWADAASAALGETQGELHNLLMKPLPSEGIKASIKNIETAANAHAKAVGFISKEEQKLIDESGKRSKLASDKLLKQAEDLAQKEQEALDKHTLQFREALQRDLDAVEQKNLTETQRLQAQLDQERQILLTAQENKLIDEESYQQQKVALENRYAEQMKAAKAKTISGDLGAEHGWMKEGAKILEQGWRNKLAGVGAIMGQLAGLMQSNRKKEFEIGKAAAISDALVSTALGVAKAWEYGPVLGPPFAAMVLAAGMMQVRAIRAQQFMGGGAANVGATPVMSVDPTGQPTAGSGGSGYQEAPVIPMQSSSGGPSRQVNIQLVADSGMVPTSWLRDKLIPAINEAYGDGVVIGVV